jgi:hypothetical protein
MQQEPNAYCEVFEVSPRDPSAHQRLPSETRDFCPTSVGWAGIIGATCVLTWLFWRMGGDDAGVGWLVISVVLGYFVADIAWTVIRRELDRRDDLAHGQVSSSRKPPCAVQSHRSPHPS